MNQKAKAYAAIAIAEEGMRQKAIEAFKFAVDGYFIIGGTDYSASRYKLATTRNKRRLYNVK